ncbi:MAG: radical SAM protein [Spirochaetales bacterium]|nr:radical SAM protein [Spirochaetales bacterium]
MKITNFIRGNLVGPTQDFTFRPFAEKDLLISVLEDTHLYIHIPFCKSMCPYCPYNRIRYEKSLSDQYFKALSVEIEKLSAKAEGTTISSVYIGGGTPTVDIDALSAVVGQVLEKFNVKGDIAIETTLADINDYNLKKLKEMQITMLSIGVQSFNQKNLSFLGRNYNASEIRPAIEKVRSYNFESINIDLIFAFPGQTKDELLDDLRKADALNVDQITAYPLFTFPYTTVGQYMKVKKVRMPPFWARRRLYRIVYDYFKGCDYDIASVWSFKKNNEKRYSSVTRQTYLGLGAGAGSRQGDIFYFNTFSVPEYNKALLEKKQLPLALAMPISPKLADWYWLYWKLYETKFSISELQRIGDRKMRLIFRVFHSLKFFNIKHGQLQLTERGSFWIHLIQNQFMLNYINKVWSIMKVEAYPEEIRI